MEKFNPEYYKAQNYHELLQIVLDSPQMPQENRDFILQLFATYYAKDELNKNLEYLRKKILELDGEKAIRHLLNSFLYLESYVTEFQSMKLEEYQLIIRTVYLTLKKEFNSNEEYLSYIEKAVDNLQLDYV